MPALLRRLLDGNDVLVAQQEDRLERRIRSDPCVEEAVRPDDLAAEVRMHPRERCLEVRAQSMERLGIERVGVFVGDRRETECRGKSLLGPIGNGNVWRRVGVGQRRPVGRGASDPQGEEQRHRCAQRQEDLPKGPSRHGDISVLGRADAGGPRPLQPTAAAEPV